LAAIASDALHCTIALQEGKDITQLNLNFPCINYTSSSNQVSSHLQLLATLSLQEAALLLSEGGLAQKIANSFTTSTTKRDPCNNADGDDDDNKEEEQEEEEEEEMQPAKKRKNQSAPVNSDDDNIENTPPSKKFHRYLKTNLIQGKSDGAFRNPLPLFPSSSSSLPTTKDAPDDADDLKVNAANITTTIITQPTNNSKTTTTTTNNNNNNNPTEHQHQKQERQEPPRTTRWRQFSDGRCIVNITSRVLDQAEISLPLSIRSSLFRHITINNYKRGRIILHCTPPTATPSSSSAAASAAAPRASQLPVQEYSAEIYRRPVRTDAILRYLRPMVQGLNLAANDVLVFNACPPSSVPPSEGAAVDDHGGGFHNANTKLNHFSVHVIQASNDQAKEHIAWVRQQLFPSTVGTTDNNGSRRREKSKSSASYSHSNASTVPVPATRVLPIRAVRFTTEAAATITTITTAPGALATSGHPGRRRGQTRAHFLVTIHDTDSEEKEEEATSPGPSSSPSISPTAQPRRRGRGGRKKADNKEDPDFLPKRGVKIAVGGRKRKRVLRSNSTGGGGGGGTELRPQRLRLSSVTYNSSMYVLDGNIPPPLSVGPLETKSAGGGTGGVKNRRPGRSSTIWKKNKGSAAAASTATAGAAAAAAVAVDVFNKKERLYNFDSSSSSDDNESSDDDSIQFPSGFSRKRGTSNSTSEDDFTSGNSYDDEEEEDSGVHDRGHHLLPPSAVNAMYRGGAKTRGLSAIEAMRRMRRKQSNPQQAPCE